VIRMLAIMVFAAISAGCATRLDIKTWDGVDKGDPVKHTRVTHSMAYGIPALFPMDSSFSDGDFKVETKSVNVPNIDVGTLFEKD